MYVRSWNWHVICTFWFIDLCRFFSDLIITPTETFQSLGVATFHPNKLGWFNTGNLALLILFGADFDRNNKWFWEVSWTVLNRAIVAWVSRITSNQHLTNTTWLWGQYGSLRTWTEKSVNCIMSENTCFICYIIPNIWIKITATV